jgi:hypothetical protein
MKFHFQNFIDHVAQPRVVLDVCSRPALVCRQVSRGWSNEIKDLYRDQGTSVSRRKGDALWTLAGYDNKQTNLQSQCASPGKHKHGAFDPERLLTVHAVATPIKQYSCTLG